MKKIAAIVSLLVFSLSSVPFAAAQTRPRRVGKQPPPQTSAPQTSKPQTRIIDEDAPPPPPVPNRRPPTLGGANGTPSSGGTQTAQAPKEDEQVEIGEGDILRISTTLVTIPVSVLDRNGKYVPNLRKDDFRIYEEGQEQEVAYFASVEKPFTVALILDTSGSTKGKMDSIQQAAIEFVNQLRADDRVMVLSFDDRVRLLCEPTNDRYALQYAILQSEPGEGTKLYDAVDYVINQKFNRITGRKAIVLFTDGVDTTSRRASYESTVRDAEELDALIYPIRYDTYADTVGRMGGGGRRRAPTIGDIFGSILSGRSVIITTPSGGANCAGCTPEEYERGAQYLQDLAQKTGTRVQEASDDPRYLSQAFSVISEELRRQYSIGYYPKGSAQAGERRQIRVQVRQPNMAVRARDSYIFKGQSSTPPDQPQQRPAPTMRDRQIATRP